MKHIRIIAFGILMVISFTLKADVKSCPWINTATAADILGVDSTISVTVNAPEGYATTNISTCKFHFVKKNISGDLQIDIKPISSQGVSNDIYMKGCIVNPEKLQAIGNEAYMCSMSNEENADKAVQRERAFGRIRNREFIITLLLNNGADIPKSNYMIKEKLLLAVDQVIGNLY